ncbi:P63C domain-containing protein [Phytomonospora sp. NPDC050363]|uniref:P63C domain-containing protein n=1 Tax=Phytomonospora sp. NPDC050363 TaxID=3155642 RepID=UPI0033FF4ED8
MVNLDPAGQGHKGGKARLDKLTQEERSELARAAAEARWGTTVQVATHVGKLVIGNLEINCAVLEDGTRVLNQATVLGALGRRTDTGRRTRDEDGQLMAPFLSAANLREFISAELREASEPIQYREKGQQFKSWGYRADMLPMVCDVYLEARDHKRLSPNQGNVARAAEILVRGLARTGIVALVDEATGYQEVRARDELRRILEAYVQAELRPWVRRFPDEFFRQVYRLQGWEYKPGTSKRTPYVGKLINKYIYEQLPPGVLDELRDRNPRNERGNRRYAHHQLLTSDTGHPHLDKQISTVTTLMRASVDKAMFEDLFERAYAVQVPLPLVIDVE